MPLGGLITLLVLLPNLLFLVFPPLDRPAEGEVKGPLHHLMEGIERVGQALSFIIPFIYQLPFVQYQPASRASTTGAAIVMALALVFYYAGWARYIAQGRRGCQLFEPMLGVPLPLALSPVIYFAATAVLLKSWPLAVASVLLAVGHLFVSQQAHQHCRQSRIGPIPKTSI